MKILHISCNLRGGAGKNLVRHHQQLCSRGIESRIVVRPTEPDGLTQGIYPFREDDFEQLVSWADIVELRQLHGGGFPPWIELNYLSERLKGKKVVWRLSDMWAFTGYCTYSFDCDRWRSGCGNCPQFGDEVNKAEIWKPEADTSQQGLQEKKAFFENLPIHVVCPSNWLANAFRASPMSAASCEVIPIGVEAGNYELDRKQCRENLGLAADAIYLLAGSTSMKNYRKGMDLLLDSLKQLETRKKLKLLVTGKSELVQRVGEIECINLGFKESDEEMAQIYAAADLFLFPSRADNSPQAIVEAQAAGLPVVALEVGGVPEYLDRSLSVGVQQTDPSSFAVAIEQALNALPDDRSLSRCSSGNWPLTKQTEHFAEFYFRILKF